MKAIPRMIERPASAEPESMAHNNCLYDEHVTAIWAGGRSISVVLRCPPHFTCFGIMSGLTSHSFLSKADDSETTKFLQDLRALFMIWLPNGNNRPGRRKSAPM